MKALLRFATWIGWQVNHVGWFLDSCARKVRDAGEWLSDRSFAAYVRRDEK